MSAMITKRRFITLCACVTTAFVGFAGPATMSMVTPGGMVPHAAALPFPMTPDSPEIKTQWINPAARSQDDDAPVRVLLESLEPSTIHVGDTTRARLRISNKGSEAVRNLSIQAQRASRQNSLADARSILASDSSAFQVAGLKFKLPDQLEPNQEIIIDVELPTAPDQDRSLSISNPGIYPLTLNVNGDQGQGDTYVGSTHFLLSVLNPDTQSVSDETQESPGMTMLWPLSAKIDIIAGETGAAPGSAHLILKNENLAAELAQGGRLYQLLDAYVQATTEGGAASTSSGAPHVTSNSAAAKLREGSCLALDPQLVDTVSRMSQGYSVADQRPSPVAPKLRLRDSWGSEADDVPSTPGSSPVVAGEWLAKLRGVAKDSCVVALPWANADINALGRTGNEWLLREALSQGASTIEQIVGVAPLRNVVVPASGYVTEQTVAGLGVADSPLEDTTGDANGNTGDSPQQLGASGNSTSGSSNATPARKPEDAWEYAQSHNPGVTEPANPHGGETALNDNSLPNPDSGFHSSQPNSPIRVLVSDNTVWDVPRAGQFAALGPNIMGVGYQSSLAATLAALGTDPETVGYSSPATRFDFRIDSGTARSLNAQAALRMSVDEKAHSTNNGESADNTPILVTPSALLGSVDDARALLNTASDLLSHNLARPVPLTQAITPSAEQEADLQRQSDQAGSSETSSRFGAPYDDPTVATDTEILRVTQQGNYIDDLTHLMVNDPAIALTRYQFTAPLQRDLLRALTLSGRRSLATYDPTVAETDSILNLNREMLVNLRRSVTLLPPGNVYTRTSASSPLLIVARNGLPLPVDAHIMYQGPEGAVIHTPDQQRIPAQGSITTQMTADLPNDRERTDLTLWLATPSGNAISDSVDIGVQTRAGFFGIYGVVALIVGLIFALLFRMRRMVKKPNTTSPASDATKRSIKAAQTDSSVSSDTTDDTRHERRLNNGHADQNSGSPRPPGR
ncbi:hypothetical protein [Corynebacterium durum]|uniref:hypothetical protein n=1 Tax=Corynebacterium durum TaxID=61592 RepID=UPI0028E9E4D8|nr:hypothetical protein [Corynebacterium durum]